MKLIIYSMLILSVLSCQQSTGIKKVLISADSVAINYFKGNGSADTVVKMVMIKDKVKLNELALLIDADIINAKKCGFDGTIHFFTKDMVLMDIGFRMNDKNCRHFSFMFEGKNYNTLLSDKASVFLMEAKR